MSVANRPVQSQEVKNLKFQISEEEGFPIYAAKLKNLIRCVVTTQLIWVFVFAYPICKIWFSHDAAHNGIVATFF